MSHSRMTDSEAIAVCEEWFRYIRYQKEKAETLARAASLARKGQRDEAMRIKRQVDSSPSVYDGARLEPAVRHLVARVSAGQRTGEET